MTIGVSSFILSLFVCPFGSLLDQRRRFDTTLARALPATSIERCELLLILLVDRIFIFCLLLVVSIAFFTEIRNMTARTMNMKKPHI